MEKVAFYLPSLVAGGAERVFVNLVNGMAEKGVAVDLILGKAIGDYLVQVSPSVNIVDLDADRVIYSIKPLAIYIKNNKPHALVAALDHANVAMMFAKIFSLTKVKTIVTVHTTISIGNNGNPIRSKLNIWLMKVLYPFASAIVCVSDGVLKDLTRLIKLPLKKCHVIYNPIIFNKIYEMAREVNYHKFFQSESVVIIGIGRLCKDKDFENLIKAFFIFKQHHKAKLIILGDGEERQRLEQLVKSLNLSLDVDLPGFVDNPYKYLSRSKLFVLSSRCEGLPTVLVEALALGLNVVSTDCESGPREILCGSWSNSLVPIEDSAALAIAMNEGINNSERNFDELFLDKYTVEYSVNKYIGIINEASNGRK